MREEGACRPREGATPLGASPGASTGEAEEVSAAMAADEIRDYLEHGIIRNSVNFPETALKRKGEGVARLTIVNRNIPGVLGEITTLIGKQNVGDLWFGVNALLGAPAHPRGG